ncbi:MAG: WD40 repeat domain-containing protein, partial [Elainellaceae cyanobacterium]
SFSPDGSQISTAASDGSARLWSAPGELVQEFSGHQGRVLSVSFSPDGSQIATASEDGTARLWQVLGLDELMAFGCNWLGDYLRHSAEATDSDRALCNVESEGPTDEANSRATNSLQNIVRTLQRTLNIG